MVTTLQAILNDGSRIDVEVTGDDGPVLLTCARTTMTPGPEAEQMRAWGADPDLGRTLVHGLAADGYRVVSADYEGHLMAHPQPTTLTATAVAEDLSAIASAAGVSAFAYYGYSWLALAGLQLALRDDRLTGLAMGGFPPVGGPYADMLTVTAATHRMACAGVGGEGQAAAPGDWDDIQVTQTPDQTRQFVTLYESLMHFDDRAAALSLDVPGLAFAGTEDDIVYGPRWDDAHVRIASALRSNQALLEQHGWTVDWVPGADHMAAMSIQLHSTPFYSFLLYSILFYPTLL